MGGIGEWWGGDRPVWVAALDHGVDGHELGELLPNVGQSGHLVLVFLA